jgi:uncharacterized protein YlzI (FlbEa/FlbD family)
MDMQGCGEVKETELDVLLQCHEEMFGKVEYVTEREAEGNNAMEWSDIEFENGEMYVGENKWEKLVDIIRHDMEWSSVQLESGEVHVGQNNYGELAGNVLDMIGLQADMNCDMEWNAIELETGEKYVGQNTCEEVVGQVLDLNGLEMECSVELKSGEVCVGQNNFEEVAGEVLDLNGLTEDMNYDTKWNNVKLETGEVKKRKRMNRRH